MPRSRVLSFMSSFGIKDSSSSTQPSSRPQSPTQSTPSRTVLRRDSNSSPANTSTTPTQSATPATRVTRSTSRPTSMVYAPPLMGTARNEHIEELVPVFSFLSSHSNKLYQEGYFLKLNDLDTNGKPNTDRNWTECFAQLVGTVLSLWDATALDAAGQDGEVAPTFINLADASIKMIETLPTRNQDVQPLQNVLSVSTAGKNRYLLHFNSLHSLTQWTAGIRLAMFEHASLHELYTGSLIAGKGKHLNNIRTIMEKSKFRNEDWARVRFGAGTPWRRCWCVIEPPDEKELKRSQSSIKKKSAYERPVFPKGDIKFYDSKKTKKAIPIATITDAYAAYAVYPQSKPLIDQSTLVKVEGRITIHSTPESKTEGFVFVMPEVHPAVSGFEMMLRWLFPVYDSFHLYGRPTRLLADTLDTRGLMFAMPQERRYGYLEIMDVASLIHTDGSEKWTEREWRKQMKELTSRRMSMLAPSRTSNVSRERGPRNSTSSRNGNIRYGDNVPALSHSSLKHRKNQSTDAVFSPPKKTATSPPDGAFAADVQNVHTRSVSELMPSKNKLHKDPYRAARASIDPESSPRPPPAAHINRLPYREARPEDGELTDSQSSSVSDLAPPNPAYTDAIVHDIQANGPPSPVSPPPDFAHQPGERPAAVRPSEQLRRERSRMSNSTLSQLVDANKSIVTNGSTAAMVGATTAWKTRDRSQDQGSRAVNENPTAYRKPADQALAYQGMVADNPFSDDKIAAVAASQSSIAQQPQDTTRQSSSKSLPREPSTHSISRKPVASKAPPVPQFPGEDPYVDGALHHSFQTEETPDFASTRKSTETNTSEKSIIRPRTGVLKTVGQSVSDTSVPQMTNANIPTVDFGPTRSLTPANLSRPTTAGSLGDSRRMGYGRPPTPKSPLDGKRPVYNDDSGSSPESRPTPPPKSLSYGDRSMAWHPGVSTGPGQRSPGDTLTAEEFVQQRAAAARAPNGYNPRRMASSPNLERPLSADWSKQREAIIRTQSRNNSPTMYQQKDYAANLSAREQEHIARMTGGPLLNVPATRGKTPDPSAGLIGAIEAREQEKRQVKEGVSGQMVQNALVQKQQHQQQHTAQLAAQLAYQNPQFAQQQFQQGRPNNYPPSQNQYTQSVDPRQNMVWANPQAQAYWDSLSPPQQQQQRQQQQQYPQQQYPQQLYQQQQAFYQPSPYQRPSQHQAQFQQAPPQQQPPQLYYQRQFSGYYAPGL